VALAASYKLPAIYSVRHFIEIGGLLSYGTDFADGFHQAGIYVGKILKGAKPVEAIGITVPPNLIARADEVIE
jgi:ABC-type uncharacterized transport system substrate-binding protein